VGSRAPNLQSIVAYYAAASSLLLASAIFILMGLIRVYQPELWDLLVSRGVIQINGPPGEFFQVLSPESQGAAMIFVACIFVAGGVVMLWFGRFLVRGIRFILSLSFDQIRVFAGKARQVIRRATAPAAEQGNNPAADRRMKLGQIWPE
jgi:hypothetical protein